VREITQPEVGDESLHGRVDVRERSRMTEVQQLESARLDDTLPIPLEEPSWSGCGSLTRRRATVSAPKTSSSSRPRASVAGTDWKL
jgi:hypothetical protein